MWTSHCQRNKVLSRTSAWANGPMDRGLTLNVALVDELWDVNHSMDHPMESQDTLLPIHPQLRAGLTAHTPSVQLGKRMLPTAPNEAVPISVLEAVPISVLGLPSFMLPVLRLHKWHNTMLPSGETAIKQDHLPRLEDFELGPKGGNATSLLHSRGSPTPSVGIKIRSGYLTLPSRGPKRGGKCYVTPAFSGIPNKGGRNQK